MVCRCPIKMQQGRLPVPKRQAPMRCCGRICTGGTCSGLDCQKEEIELLKLV